MNKNNNISRYIEQGRWEEAFNLLESLLHQGVWTEKEAYQLNLCLLKLGKPEKALIYINKAIEKWPDQVGLLSERGVIYFHLGKKSLALLDLDQAVLLEPENPYRYSSRAYIKDSLGDVEGAIRDYEKALELDPDDAIAHNNLGLLYEKLGYIEKARKKFEMADKITRLEKEFYLLENHEWGKETYHQVNEKEKENVKKLKGWRRWKAIIRIIRDVFFNRNDRKAFFQFLKRIVWKNKNEKRGA